MSCNSPTCKLVVYLLSRCFYQKLLSGKTNITWNIWISFWLAFNICIQHLYVICYSKWIIYTSIKKTWYEQCCKKRSNHYPAVLEMVFLYMRPFRHLLKHSCSEDFHIFSGKHSQKSSIFRKLGCNCIK